LNASSVRIAEGPNPFLLDWGLCTQRNATQRYATLRWSQAPQQYRPVVVWVQPRDCGVELLPREEAQRIAAIFAKLPELLGTPDE